MPDHEPVSSGALQPSPKARKDAQGWHPHKMAKLLPGDLSKAQDDKAGAGTDTSKAETVARYFNGFFQAILGLSTLGASVTFSFVISSGTTFASLPATATFRSHEVSRFLAVSWLLFILALASSSILNTILQFYHDDALAWWSKGGRDKRIVLWYASVTSSLLYALIIGAFIFLSLVVAAFQPAIGWTALSFTTLFGIAGLLSIVLRTPLGLSWLSRVLREFGKKPKGIISTPGTARGSADEGWYKEDSRHAGIEQESIV